MLKPIEPLVGWFNFRNPLLSADVCTHLQSGDPECQKGPHARSRSAYNPRRRPREMDTRQQGAIPISNNTEKNTESAGIPEENYRI